MVRLALLCLALSGCASLDSVDDARTALRQSKDRLDAIVQQERADQLQDALDELCNEAPIGGLMQRFRGDLTPLRSLCGWDVQQ